MKKALLFLSFGVLLAACSKKDDNPTPNPNPGTGTGTTTNPYYFKFTLDGKSYNLGSAQPQYLSSYDHAAGGFVDMGPLAYPSIKLEFLFDSVVSDAMMKSLAGKTYYFDGDNPAVSIDFDSTINSETLYSVDTASRDYFVKVNSITYLKKDTTIFNPVAVYVINGTCKAMLRDYPTQKRHLLTGGDFNFLVSRVDKK